MRFVSLPPCTPAAWADEYRYTGNAVRVIDGDSLIIDVPRLARTLPAGRREEWD